MMLEGLFLNTGRLALVSHTEDRGQYTIDDMSKQIFNRVCSFSGKINVHKLFLATILAAIL